MYSERRDWTCSISSEATGAIGFKFAALQRVQHADRLDRMLVDGEDVVGVELHLADDARPVGQIAAEEPGFVQDRQPFGAVRVAGLPGGAGPAPCRTAGP